MTTSPARSRAALIGGLCAWVAWSGAFAQAGAAAPAGASAPLGHAGPRLSTQLTSNAVDGIAPEHLAQAIRQTRGRLYVLLTSTDPKCGYCVRGNPVFLALAARHHRAGRFFACSWEPWTDALASAVAREHRVVGIPVVLVFDDGAVVERVYGAWPLPELERRLGFGEGPVARPPS